jgi:hypothetical protein
VPRTSATSAVAVGDLADDLDPIGEGQQLGAHPGAEWRVVVHEGATLARAAGDQMRSTSRPASATMRVAEAWAQSP